MKKKQQDEEDEDGQDLEIIKAVAQAWHGHSGSSRTTSEFNAHRHSFKTRPTRFKLEGAATKVSVSSSSLTTSDKNGFTSWDFGQSLLDSYEIVAVSKKLETGLVLDNTFSLLDDPKGSSKRRKESKNSLRNLFSRMSSSKRFSDTNIPLEGGN